MNLPSGREPSIYLSIYLSIYRIYIAPLQGNYSEALLAQAPGKKEGLKETINLNKYIISKRPQMQ